MHKTHSLILAVAVAICGCATNRSPAKIADDLSKLPAASATLEAGEFLMGLRKQGRLPGLTKDDHGNISGEVPDDLNTVRYPFLRSFRITKRGDDSTYHYTVERESRTSTWQLRKAWRTGSAGTVLQEYPLQ